MRVLVTGATGFVGRYVVTNLIANGHEVIAVTRSIEKALTNDWLKNDLVALFEYDLGKQLVDANLFSHFKRPDLLIHLAWEGLPNYKNMMHIEINLHQQYAFLKNLIQHGLKDITITGTCLEYGMQNGSLDETVTPKPQNPYAVAKNTLRIFLELLNNEHSFSLKWVRLFYMFGEGQSKSSILPSLQKAIDEQLPDFQMSGGEQLRDYLPIETVADYIVRIAVQNNVCGVINCSSGKPISIRKLVEDYKAEQNSNIKLVLGHYPYPDFEPLAFWGCTKKLNSIIA